MVATVALAAVLWLRRGDEAALSGRARTAERGNSTAGSGAESQAPSRAGTAGSAAQRPRPMLEVRDGGAAVPAVAFADEKADPAWAGPQAAEVTRVARKALAGDELQSVAELSRVDCRDTRCRFDVAARDPARLPDILAVLEDDRGFYGVAKELSVVAMERNAAGQPVRMTIVLTFDRNPPGGNPDD